MGGNPRQLLDGIGDLMIPERRNEMDKKNVVLMMIITLIIMIIIVFNQRTLYKDNERLLEMVEMSEEIADGYKESYEKVISQQDEIQELHEKEIQTYIELLNSQSETIGSLGIRLTDTEIKYENLLDAYNKKIGNK